MSNGPWAVVRGPWDGEQAWRPRAYGATNLSKLETRTTHHGSGARAAFSVADCGSTVVAPCNRLRRLLRQGLGPVLLKWLARRASRLGYHGTRTVGIGFRRRGKEPSRVFVSTVSADTEAAALLRRRGEGGAEADGADL